MQANALKVADRKRTEKNEVIFIVSLFMQATQKLNIQDIVQPQTWQW